MEFFTQQVVNPKIEENPLQCDHLELDPFPNSTTLMFEAPQIDHGYFNPLMSLPLLEDYYNQIPHTGAVQGFEDYYIPWDLSKDIEFDTNFASSTYFESSNGQCDFVQPQASVMTQSCDFSLTQCDPVVFDDKPFSTMVGSFDYLINNPTDVDHYAMNESFGVSPLLCDSWAYDEMLLRPMVESLNNNYQVPMMVETSSDVSPHCDSMVLNEAPVSTMVESFHSLSNVPNVFDHYEPSIVNETTAPSSHCDALVLYELPLSKNVDSFEDSDIPALDLSEDEVSVMIESGFPSSTRRSNQQMMKTKSDSLDLEDIREYFHLPITTAAKKLNVGVTLLKRRCREIDIKRWPHRKIRSLNSLIDAVKAMGLWNEIKLLEQNKRVIEQVPKMGLTVRSKKLRQSIFKANYNNKKRSMLQHLDDC